MSSNHVRNTNGLKEYTQSKKDEVINLVDNVIQKLIIGNKPINFNNVSIEADVSKTYLYTHEDIRRRIEELRVKQAEVFSSKNKKIKELSEEIRDLKQQLMYL